MEKRKCAIPLWIAAGLGGTATLLGVIMGISKGVLLPLVLGSFADKVEDMNVLPFYVLGGLLNTFIYIIAAVVIPRSKGNLGITVIFGVAYFISSFMDAILTRGVTYYLATAVGSTTLAMYSMLTNFYNLICQPINLFAGFLFAIGLGISLAGYYSEQTSNNF